MKYWFLIFSHEKAEHHNSHSFGWQNPIIYIKAGFNHVLTGNFKSHADMKIGDKVYLYSGKIGNDSNTNGIYGIGIIVDILQGTKDNSHAVIELENKGTPIISYYKDEKLFNSWIMSARPKYGYTELDSNTAQIIDSYL